MSNLGRIKSLKHLKPRILKTFVNNKGYARVSLSQNGVSHHYLVSRIVATAFCPNTDPANANTVDHIDGDRLNNQADNLRWLSLSDNMKAYLEGRQHDESEDSAV